MSRRRAPVLRVNIQSPYIGTLTPETDQGTSQVIMMKQFIADHIDEINRIIDLIQSLLASSDDPKFKYLKNLLSHFKFLLGVMYPPTNSAGPVPSGYAPSSLPPPAPLEPTPLPPPASKPDWKAVLEKLERIEPNASDVKDNWGGILDDIKRYVNDNRPSEDRPPP